MNSDPATSTQPTACLALSGCCRRAIRFIRRAATRIRSAWRASRRRGSCATARRCGNSSSARVLPALRQAELPLAAHAWHAFGAPDWPRVGELCRLSSALKTAREARAAAGNIGRQRAELVAALHQPSAGAGISGARDLRKLALFPRRSPRPSRAACSARRCRRCSPGCYLRVASRPCSRPP